MNKECEHLHIMQSSSNPDEVECLDCGAEGSIDWQEEEEECDHVVVYMDEHQHAVYCGMCGELLEGS